jgi:RNA recognition motif-containing protein
MTAEEVTTVFIGGFPDDFKEREFINMFSFASGFEGASLKSQESFLSLSVLEGDQGHTALSPSSRIGSFTRQLIGFARFHSRVEAVEAIDRLNGRVVDQERGSILKVEMAKKNLFIPVANPLKVVKSGSLSEEIRETNGNVSTKSPFFTDANELLQGFERAKYIRSLSLSVPGQPNPVPITAPADHTSSSPDLSLPLLNFQRPATAFSSIPSSIHSPASLLSFANPNLSGTVTPSMVVGENPPCNTLYVGNLPMSAS